MNKILLILILVVFQNCASFKEPIVKGNLRNDNLSSINGIYNNYPSSGGGFYVKSIKDVFYRNINMFDFKTDKIFQNEKLEGQITVISQKLINLKIRENEKIIFDKNLKVKLKEDGYLYIKEKITMIDGFPLIFGGWNVQKSRINITDDNKLFIESNYFFCNGILIVISDWKTLNYSLSFEKK